MGQAESQPQSGLGNTPSSASSSSTLAFHVLRVAENSPAAEAGIEPFFDFIVGAAGRQLVRPGLTLSCPYIAHPADSASVRAQGDDLDLLTDVLEVNEGGEVALQIYSTKRKEVRGASIRSLCPFPGTEAQADPFPSRPPAEVYVIPSRTWSSAAASGTTAGSVDGEPSLLGLSLRLCNPHHALDQVWHVLEILEGSPAQSAGASALACLSPSLLLGVLTGSMHLRAGLVPYGDWIVGYAGGVLRGEGDFYDVVEAVRLAPLSSRVQRRESDLHVLPSSRATEADARCSRAQHVDKPLRLFVYNSDYDVTREAILVPNRSWGGEGLLGCGVGYGLLHRIPKPQDGARPSAQAYDDDPYAAPAPPPAQRAPPPPSSSAQRAPPPPQQQQQQQQQQYRSPPPQQKNDRLTSFSSTSGKLPNPLYAPPPPRASSSASRPPVAASASPPSAPAPRPARRTAALSSFDDHAGGGGAGAQPHERSYYGDDDPYALDSSQSQAQAQAYGYGSAHPSFASYGAGQQDEDEGGYSGGAYDASEGVEVVAVHEGDDDEGDFARPGGGGGGAGGYGRARASYGAARVVAEEAE